MSAADWVSPILAFVGAGVGAALAYVTATRATAQTEQQGRREEWGRRFTTALSDFVSTDVRQRTLGRAMIVALLGSELASDDDRALAHRLLSADATRGLEARAVGAGAEADPAADRTASARALVELAGGLDKVDPGIARIATAAPPTG